MHHLVVLPNVVQPIEAGGGTPAENVFSDSPASPSRWNQFKSWLAGDIIETKLQREQMRNQQRMNELSAAMEDQLLNREELLQKAHEDQKLSIHAGDMRATLKKETRALENYVAQVNTELDKRRQKLTHLETCAKHLGALQNYETEMYLKKDPSVQMYTQISTGDSGVGIFIATSKLQGYIEALEKMIQQSPTIVDSNSSLASRVDYLLANPAVTPAPQYSLVWHHEYGWGKMKPCIEEQCPEKVMVKFTNNKPAMEFRYPHSALKINQPYPVVDLPMLRRDTRPWAQSTLQAWEARNKLASHAKQLHSDNEASKTEVEEKRARLQEAWEAFQSKWIVVNPEEWNIHPNVSNEIRAGLKDVKLRARIMPCADMHGATC